MDLAATGLREQPFRTHGKPSPVVAYSSQLEALEVLRETCASPTGLCLIQGPALSGKSTLIQHFAEEIPADCAYAIVDGSNLSTTSFLQTVLRQFGYDVSFDTDSELLGMLRVFAEQQAALHVAPILIVENVHELSPSGLHALSELAAAKVRWTSAVRLVLVSDRSLRPIVEAPGMDRIAKRLTADFHLRPMSCEEACRYLHLKLTKAGCEAPDSVFPVSVCNAMWEASGGWPGILDRVALLALARAKSLPVSVANVEKPVLPDGTWDAQAIENAEAEIGEAPAAPTLLITQKGKKTLRLTFDKPRLLIGRSEHNDVSIESQFVSRHHMLLVRHGSATFLMDLNSTNGTFVNSRRVSNHLLIDNDIISIGHHRIKFSDPHARQRGKLDDAEFADTAIMKTLDDMRSLLAQENTEVMPTPSENVPTLGN